ncbi:MAG: TatD family hydrolase [Gammaproteobacteria bacterium]|nr:TatD family hydrolase [Gammaproteobacteria bacterium]
MVDKKMMLIDPHIHMTSRTTDDLVKLNKAGVVAIIEPAFWLGQPRTTVGSFQDYFSSLIGWERFRAGQFGIRHYCAIGLNAKEANNEALAEEVMELIPLYACKEGVVAIGEIGLDDQTALEEKYYRRQLDIAKELDMVVNVHTPHRDKKQGTIRSMEICIEHGIDPNKVIIDHNNEETAKEVLDRGFWAAFTIYPKTKMGNERMIEILKTYGTDHIMVDSSADWGCSDVLSVYKTSQLMLERGVPIEQVRQVCYQNALTAYGQSGKMKEEDWTHPSEVDDRALFQGNSVLRGQTSGLDYISDSNVVT